MVESMHSPTEEELAELVPALTDSVVRHEISAVLGTDKPESVDEVVMGLVERGMWTGVNAVRRAPDHFVRLLMETADYDELGEEQVEEVPRDVAEELNGVIRTREWDLLEDPYAALREYGAPLAYEWARKHPHWYASAVVDGFEAAPYYYGDVC